MVAYKLHNSFSCSVLQRTECHPGVAKAHNTAAITRNKYILHDRMELNTGNFCSDLDGILSPWPPRACPSVVVDNTTILAKLKLGHTKV